MFAFLAVDKKNRLTANVNQVNNRISDANATGMVRPITRVFGLRALIHSCIISLIINTTFGVNSRLPQAKASRKSSKFHTRLDLDQDVCNR